MSAHNAEELALLDARFGSGTPATWHVGLSTTTPAEDGTGITEPTGGAYARVAVTNDAAGWPAATTVGGLGQKSNGAAVTFPQATGSWGTVTHFVLFDAATGGTARWSGPLDVAKAVASGDTASFAAGALKITMD